MEDEAFSFGFSNASTSYQSRVKSHFELCIDFDDVDGDDELKTGYPCPFCAEDFDLLELWCHIDLEHQNEAKSGICPVCALRVGMYIVEHMTAKHGNIFKSHHKSRRCKFESYPTLSEKDLQDGCWQSFPAGSSHVISSSKTTRDPFLSFLYSAASADERENVQPDSSSEISLEEIHSDEADDSALERDVQPCLSNKDQIESARRSEFVRGLFMSTILDPDF
ncbi:protein DEHYDRATION-INDUCED 19 homolog 4-like [Gastrolobium bilobum]|uniref:protein DEHYDRATION-INDUCED 19 homolog 4-like n=1 Tax=Gastrolobium bilobum TaxID=150636 RepID=UPI002AB2DB7E|nr:protein DEHYDRATION-INDUCED 19 homolog 4-like [Gastrolobium bilobum]